MNTARYIDEIQWLALSTLLTERSALAARHRRERLAMKRAGLNLAAKVESLRRMRGEMDDINRRIEGI